MDFSFHLQLRCNCTGMSHVVWNVNEVINFLGAVFTKYVCYVGLCGELLTEMLVLGKTGM